MKYLAPTFVISYPRVKKQQKGNKVRKVVCSGSSNYSATLEFTGSYVINSLDPVDELDVVLPAQHIKLYCTVQSSLESLPKDLILNMITNSFTNAAFWTPMSPRITEINASTGLFTVILSAPFVSDTHSKTYKRLQSININLVYRPADGASSSEPRDLTLPAYFRYNQILVKLTDYAMTCFMYDKLKKHVPILFTKPGTLESMQTHQGYTAIISKELSNFRSEKSHEEPLEDIVSCVSCIVDSNMMKPVAISRVSDIMPSGMFFL